MDITGLINVYGWPFLAILLLVVVAILLFRERGGIKTLKLGPFEVGFSDKSQSGHALKDSSLKTALDGNNEVGPQLNTWNKPVNIFYLGWDLGRASATAQHQGDRDEIEYHLIQADFHASELSIKDTASESLKRLASLLQSGSKGVLTGETFHQIDNGIRNAVGKIATMAATRQTKVNLFPNSELKGKTKGVEYYRKAEVLDGIYKWVEEYLDATALLFHKASETLEEWRAAVDGYEKSYASYPRILARAKSLKHENLVRSLELLTDRAEDMKKLAQGKWNSSDKDNPEMIEAFNISQDMVADCAASIHEFLYTEIAKL